MPIVGAHHREADSPRERQGSSNPSSHGGKGSRWTRPFATLGAAPRTPTPTLGGKSRTLRVTDDDNGADDAAILLEAASSSGGHGGPPQPSGNTPQRISGVVGAKPTSREEVITLQALWRRIYFALRPEKRPVEAMAARVRLWRGHPPGHRHVHFPALQAAWGLCHRWGLDARGAEELSRHLAGQPRTALRDAAARLNAGLGWVDVESIPGLVAVMLAERGLGNALADVGEICVRLTRAPDPADRAALVALIRAARGTVFHLSITHPPEWPDTASGFAPLLTALEGLVNDPVCADRIEVWCEGAAHRLALRLGHGVTTDGDEGWTPSRAADMAAEAALPPCSARFWAAWGRGFDTLTAAWRGDLKTDQQVAVLPLDPSAFLWDALPRASARGLAFQGTLLAPLHDSPPGRLLLAALDVVERDFPTDAVCSLLPLLPAMAPGEASPGEGISGAPGNDCARAHEISAEEWAVGIRRLREAMAVWGATQARVLWTPGTIERLLTLRPFDVPPLSVEGERPAWTSEPSGLTRGFAQAVEQRLAWFSRLGDARPGGGARALWELAERILDHTRGTDDPRVGQAAAVVRSRMAALARSLADVGEPVTIPSVGKGGGGNGQRPTSSVGAESGWTMGMVPAERAPIHAADLRVLVRAALEFPTRFHIQPRWPSPLANPPSSMASSADRLPRGTEKHTSPNGGVLARSEGITGREALEPLPPIRVIDPTAAPLPPDGGGTLARLWVLDPFSVASPPSLPWPLATLGASPADARLAPPVSGIARRRTSLVAHLNVAETVEFVQTRFVPSGEWTRQPLFSACEIVPAHDVNCSPPVAPLPDILDTTPSPSAFKASEIGSVVPPSSFPPPSLPSDWPEEVERRWRMERWRESRLADFSAPGDILKVTVPEPPSEQSNTTLLAPVAADEEKIRRDAGNYLGVPCPETVSAGIHAEAHRRLRSLSATRLRRYGECPMREWLERYWNATPTATMRAELDARVEGTWLHTVLERILAPSSSGNRQRRNVDDWLAALSAAAPVPPPSAALHRMRMVLALAIEREQARLPITGAIIHAVEMPFGFEKATDGENGVPIEVPTLNGDGYFSLQGRIDRIDRLPTRDGEEWMVIDYKRRSGKPPWTGEGLSVMVEAMARRDFQLPLYLWALRHHLEAQAPTGPQPERLSATILRIQGGEGPERPWVWRRGDPALEAFFERPPRSVPDVAGIVPHSPLGETSEGQPSTVSDSVQVEAGGAGHTQGIPTTTSACLRLAPPGEAEGAREWPPPTANNPSAPLWRHIAQYHAAMRRLHYPAAPVRDRECFLCRRQDACRIDVASARQPPLGDDALGG